MPRLARGDSRWHLQESRKRVGCPRLGRGRLTLASTGESQASRMPPAWTGETHVGIYRRVASESDAPGLDGGDSRSHLQESRKRVGCPRLGRGRLTLASTRESQASRMPPAWTGGTHVRIYKRVAIASDAPGLGRGRLTFASTRELLSRRMPPARTGGNSRLHLQESRKRVGCPGSAGGDSRSHLQFVSCVPLFCLNI